jgi:hypothetical protein
MTFSGPTETHNSYALAEVPSGIEVHTGDAGAFALARSEVEAQLDAAHKYPRSLARFRQEATTMATLSRDVAESCMYALPRAGKSITGPSVRLAEIVASAWGNLHLGSRVVEVTETEVVAQGVAWDLQTNTRITIEARRKITGKGGRRFDEDMINVTGSAAQSIALRNAIFRAVPRGLVDTIYAAARACAVGDAQTLVDRRADVLARLQKGGVTLDRILARVEKATPEDIGLGELETLIGLISSVRAKDLTVDEAFPAPGAAEGAAVAARGASAVAKLRESPPPPVVHDENGVVVEGPASPA